jgi:hypothetical protein
MPVPLRTWTRTRAGAVAEKLREAGFTVVGTGNATEATGSTTVTHPQDMRKQAEVLASRLPDARGTQSAGATAGVVALVVGTYLDPDDIR